MSAQKKVRKRQQLYLEQEGKCHWCSCEMSMGPYPTELMQRPAKNLATFEHLDSKLSGRRGHYPGERRVVLACYDCNQLRNIQELKEHHRRNRTIRRLKSRAERLVYAAKKATWATFPWYVKLWRYLTRQVK